MRPAATYAASIAILVLAGAAYVRARNNLPSHRSKRLRRPIAVVVVLVAVTVPGFALAGWSDNGTGAGSSRAKTMPAGNTPSAAVSGRNVTVSWSASTVSGGGSLDGYLVKRYNTSGQQQTIAANCSGTVAGLSCTENAVPAGSWKYTVTPAASNWRGAESPQSSAVTVAAASLALASSTVTSLPATLSGTIASFVSGQSVTYRLDDPTSGTLLTGSITPSPVPSNGTAAVSLTLPAGTANGSHTIYAIGSSGDQASASVTVTRPQISTSVIGKSAGGKTGQIKQGGSYYVYANLTGAGNPPAGVSTLKADLSNITTGATAVTLSWGSYTAGGQSYNYRSAQQTANASLTAGSKSYTLTLTDTAGSQTQGSFSVVVDNTPPTASDVQTANGGSTVSRAEAGDTITFTASEAIDPEFVFAGWSGASMGVVVHITNGLIVLGNDGLQVYNAADSAQLPLGQVDLARNDYVGGVIGGEIARFGATGTASSMTLSGNTITITLGTGSGQAATTAGGIGRMSWAPSTIPTDWAGNAMSSASVNESGANDRDF